MLDEATVAIITGAASNIVAYMLNGRADALRGWIAKVFGAGAADRGAASVESLERDSRALAQGTATALDVQTRWSMMLTALLASRPELRAELDAFAKSAASANTFHVGSQHNYGPGTFIAGPNYGSINAAPARDVQ